MSRASGRPRIARLSFAQVMRISWRNIRHRLARCLLAMGGIVLSVAFLVNMLSVAALQTDAEEGLSAQQQWLVSISLLVCAVGIVNAMLMNVMERYREIGTIKCLGALDGLIVKLFIVEAVMMGVLGALLGTLMGWLLAALTILASGESVVWSWGALLWRGAAAFALGVVITMVAAIYPAWRAARMAPADAMRAEI